MEKVFVNPFFLTLSFSLPKKIMRRKITLVKKRFRPLLYEGDFVIRQFGRAVAKGRRTAVMDGKVARHLKFWQKKKNVISPDQILSFK